MDHATSANVAASFYDTQRSSLQCHLALKRISITRYFLDDNYLAIIISRLTYIVKMFVFKRSCNQPLDSSSNHIVHSSNILCLFSAAPPP